MSGDDRDASAGSAIVAAMVVAVMLGSVAVMVSARASGASSSAAAAVHRLEARVHAEHALDDVLVRIGPTGQARLVTAVESAIASHRAGVELGDWSATPPTIEVTATSPGNGPAVLIRVEATVGTAASVASATLRLPLTTDHLWLTEHRAIDPALLQMPRLDCSRPPGDSQRSPACLDGTVPSGVLDGPVHSNEPLALVGGTILASLSSTSAVDGHTAHRTRSESVLPRDARMVAAEAEVTCRFRGPTSVRFDGIDVRVKSPRSVPRLDDPLSGPDVLGCMGVDRATLVDFVTITLPPRSVIEVIRDDLFDCVDHPLGLAVGEDAEREWWCGGGDALVWGQYRGSRTVIAEDDVQIVWDVEPQGVLGGASSVLSDDVLGLVAGDSIILRRPVGRPIRRIAPYGLNLAATGPDIPPFGSHPLDAPTSSPVVWESPRIVASLAALRGSISIQNPFGGERHAGTVVIRGSVAGRFTGVYGWEHRSATGALLGATGYPVDLFYDHRLARIPPPGMPIVDGEPLRIVDLDVG